MMWVGVFSIAIAATLAFIWYRKRRQYNANSFEAVLWRTKKVRPEDITRHEDGTTAPPAEQIYKYHMIALESLRSRFGDKVDTIRMDNVRYLKKNRIDDGTSILPVINYSVMIGLRRPIPQYANVTPSPAPPLGDQRPRYTINYGTEENLYHEERHRIMHELGHPGWADAGHGTEQDPLQSVDHDWVLAEYQKNRSVQEG